MSKEMPEQRSAEDAPAALPVGEPLAPEVLAPTTPPARSPLAGRHVRLEPIDADRDSQELYRVSHGTAAIESLWTYMAVGPFESQPAMRAYLERCAGSTDPLFLSVIDTATGRPCGMVAFMRIEPRMRCIELGNIWYAPAQQRTRINTEAIFLMLEECFDHLGYRRVEWKCDSLNRRSRAAALRLGFRFEGIFRQHLMVKGRNRDTAWFSMLDREWPARRRSFETWLASPEPPPSLAALNAALAGDD